MSLETEAGELVEPVFFGATKDRRLVELRPYVRRHGALAVPVFKSIFEDRLDGFVLAHDVLLATSFKSEKKVGEVARDRPLIEPDKSLQEAYEVLRDNGIPGAPVVRDLGERELIGVVTLHGIVKALLAFGLEPKVKTANAVYTKLGEGRVMVVRRRTPVTRIWHKVVGGEVEGAVVVGKEGEPVGVVTVWDFIKTSKWFLEREVEPEPVAGVPRGEKRRVGIMRARRLMTRGAPVATADTPIVEVARFVSTTGIELVPVVDEEGKLIGAVTLWDLARAWFEGAKEGREDLVPVEAMPIEEVAEGVQRRGTVELVRLKPAPHSTGVRAREIAGRDLPAVHINDTVSRIRRIMLNTGSTHVVVIDDEGRLVGIVSRRDMLHYLAEKREYWRLQRGRRLVVVKPVVMKGSEARFLVREDTAGDFMRAEYPTVRLDAPVEEAAYLMVANDVDFVGVVDERGGLVGVLTKDDLVRAYLRSGRGAKAGELAVPAQLVKVNPLHSLTHVVRKMRSYGLDAVAVVEGDRVVGIVSEDTLAIRPIEETLRGQRLVVVTMVRKIERGGPRKARCVKIGTWTASDIADPVAFAAPASASAKEIVRRMLEEGVTAVPVVDERGEFVGLLTKMELVKDLARAYMTSIAKVPEVETEEAEA